MRIPAVSNNYLYGKIASGKRIQSAADDAAGLSIANKMKRESNGLDVSADNTEHQGFQQHVWRFGKADDSGRSGSAFAGYRKYCGGNEV